MNAFLRCLAVAFSFALITTASAHEGKLKIATVNMTKLFKHYDAAAEARQRIAAERAKIVKYYNERLTYIHEVDKEINKLKKILKSPLLSESQRISAENELLQMKSEKSFRVRESREYLQRSNDSVNKKEQLTNESLLVELRKIVKARAKADFDYIFDNSGISTNGVPALVYSSKPVEVTKHLLEHLEKDGVNITDEVLETLNTKSP